MSPSLLVRFALALALGVASVLSNEEFEATCGDGQVIDLAEGDEFYWRSPGWMDGDDYPENTE